ncbi:hypothetical protein MHYP_G00212650 [Metynnis hypsauchen]
MCCGLLWSYSARLPCVVFNCVRERERKVQAPDESWLRGLDNRGFGEWQLSLLGRLFDLWNSGRLSRQGTVEEQMEIMRLPHYQLHTNQLRIKPNK